MFEFFCYAVAIVAVLAFVGGDRPASVAEVAPVEDDLPSLAELLADAAEMTAKPVPAVAQVITAPVAVAVVKVEATKPMTETQRLRKACTAAGIRWRNARGKGRHMTNAQMVAALA